MKDQADLSHPQPNVSFWLCAGIIAVLLSAMLSRDITRPFCGLHSWDHAHYAWVARNHLKYGLSYTKGVDTFAVGNPPTQNPSRYIDHPQLHTLVYAAAMAVLGINTWAGRAANILATVTAMLLLVKILKGLVDKKTALLAGLLFSIFPLIAYFGAYSMWLYPVSYLAIWCYLVLIEATRDGPAPGRIHKIGLAASLFFALQLGWEGFFYALAIGVHYVFRCIRRRQFPEKTLLAILIIAPLSSLMLNLTVMAAGAGWNFQKIIDLYTWRAGSAEVGRHDWGKWFAKLWEFGKNNFSLPILIVAIAYLTLGQLVVFLRASSQKQSPTEVSRQFPQFWLFVMPAIFQLTIIKGALWKHQTWERPLLLPVAIAAALGVMLVADILKKFHRYLPIVSTVVLVGVFFVYCMIGTNYYYAVRWRSPKEIKMFEMLNQKIPPDKALLSFEPFIVDQHSAKTPSYRPEIAWALDRDIVVARVIENGKIAVAKTIEDIESKVKTGKYSYYLIPRASKTISVINRLSQKYKYQYIPGQDSESKDGKFFKRGMMPYIIFDLNSKADSR